MNKDDFLRELRESLEGKMSPGAIDSNVDYYRAYIEGEIMKGRSEEEVIEELGPARLIAKTLTSDIRKEDKNRAYEDSSEQSRSNSGSGSSYSQETYDENEPGRGAMKARKIISGIIIAVVIILVLLLFGSMFRGIIYIIFRFLPFIVFFALIMWLFRGNRRQR